MLPMDAAVWFGLTLGNWNSEIFRKIHRNWMFAGKCTTYATILFYCDLWMKIFECLESPISPIACKRAKTDCKVAIENDRISEPPIFRIVRNFQVAALFALKVTNFLQAFKMAKVTFFQLRLQSMPNSYFTATWIQIVRQLRTINSLYCV